MRKYFLLLFISFSLHARIIPKEKSVLNYRLVGFSFPEDKINDKYTIEIASGDFFDEVTFKKNIITSINSEKNRMVVEVPFWGTAYTWRVIYSNGNKTVFYHFTTGYIPDIDSANSRLRIIKDTKKYNDAFVLMDDNRILYDLNGHPVWYLPNTNHLREENIGFRDLKTTPQGTISFIVGERKSSQIYEVDYDGRILWKGPDAGKVSGDSTEHYHHEFTRLANGHYMVLGSEPVLCKLPSGNDSGLSIVSDSEIIKEHYTPNSGNVLLSSILTQKDQGYKKFTFGTVIEYDEDGKVVWSWKSSKYFIASDLRTYKPLYDGGGDFRLHENSFFFDEQNHNLYVSFRDISRIVKIRYPDGKILNTYGEVYKNGVPEKEGLFCGQHSCKYSPRGYLYLFDNNDCNYPSLPKLLIVNETHKVIWQYHCSLDGENIDPKENLRFGSGGNILELANGDFFVCMGGNYSKVFIVDRDKKLQWSAILEKWDSITKSWNVLHQYRASIIQNKDLQNIIWNNYIE